MIGTVRNASSLILRFFDITLKVFKILLQQFAPDYRIRILVHY